MSDRAPTRRQPRTIPIVYGALSVILLFIIAAMALIVVPPSPPSIAEFAPQAQEHIEDSPQQQTSQFGGGAGQCFEGQVCDPETGAPVQVPGRRVIERARVRRCVGDPPRQVEDPQSPPCINFWEGDNGGSTWRGVTRDEIRVASSADYGPADQTFINFFNSRFEFYGRKIVLVGNDRLVGFDTPPAAQRARASRVSDELQAFAATSLGQGFDIYSEEVARRGVISVEVDASLQSEEGDYARLAPYQWSYGLAIDQMQRNMGRWLCSGLSDGTADFGGVDVSGKKRRVGIIVVKRTEKPIPESRWLIESLDACRATPPKIAEMAERASATEWRTTLSDFKIDNVTSIVCICESGPFYSSAMGNASNVGYFPEWLISGIGWQDRDVSLGNSNVRQEGNAFAPSTAPAAQRAHLFGVTSRNKLLRRQDSPYFWATRETNTTSTPSNGGVPEWRYPSLLLLASGIQMAGPNLTPKTFEEGLWRTRFPNPGCGGPPYYQACVGFGGGKHTMVSDMGLIWWDESEEPWDTGVGSTQPSGAFCYIRQGARYNPQTWGQAPNNEFFDTSKPCR